MSIWENGEYVSENQHMFYNGKTEFKHVYKHTSGFEDFYEANLEINGEQVRKVFNNLKDAAKYVDLQLIKSGKSPVNLLKPVK